MNFVGITCAALLFYCMFCAANRKVRVVDAQYNMLPQKKNLKNVAS